MSTNSSIVVFCCKTIFFKLALFISCNLAKSILSECAVENIFIGLLSFDSLAGVLVHVKMNNSEHWAHEPVKDGRKGF